LQVARFVCGPEYTSTRSLVRRSISAGTEVNHEMGRIFSHRTETAWFRPFRSVKSSSANGVLPMFKCLVRHFHAAPGILSHGETAGENADPGLTT
jgi:hypothetical protein